MTDTPQHIKDLQLKLWLEKTPGERLLQGLKNNEQIYLMMKSAREKMQKRKAAESSGSTGSNK